MTVPQSTKDLVNLIALEMKDLIKNTTEHLQVKEKLSYQWKPHQGAGYDPSKGYNGLPQSATSVAIERKIITLREHLNDLRKVVTK